MNTDNDVLQEFVVEAGELYEQLGDQLVELERRPDDVDLLNAVFRAFHTMKGGAGFMKLAPMVETCHRAEDVINLLRQGERQVDAELTDVMLMVLDALGGMFDAVRSGQALPPADPELLGRLDRLLRPDAAADTAASQPPQTAAEPPDSATADAAASGTADMDAEFDAMLDAVQSGADANSEQMQPAEADATVAGELITDDEFEAMLDQLHGKGKHGTLDDKGEPAPAQTGPDPITDDEFESTLDRLHRRGGVPGSGAAAADRVNSVEAPAGIEPRAGDADAIPGRPAGAAAPPATEAPRRRAQALQSESSVRVDTARLDDIMNLVGELVLVRNRLATLKQKMRRGEVVDAISNLELVATDLQSAVMKTRMQPVRKVFNRFPRVIRDLARQLHKDIRLELVGEDTEIDKSMVEALADPLIHLVRNAVDHGIETPEHRLAAGKPAQGTVTLTAKQEGDQILLTISDDGRGMDHRDLRRKAVEKGEISEDAANNLNDTEAYNLIFSPGFSTRAEISDVSGRGVGMDVVNTSISELNGSVEIDSTPGSGSVISIRLPLTLAILPTLMVGLDGYQYALPLTNVNEAFNMEPGCINLVDGQEVMRVRDKPLPLFYLSNWVTGGGRQARRPACKVIMMQVGGRRFCLVVDHIIGQEEVVIKPLGTMLYTTPGFAGATITGDGGIALIIDIAGMMAVHAHPAQLHLCAAG